MTQAIRMNATGGPEVLTWEDVQLGAPAIGEVHVRHNAVGVNYIDVYHRTGAYPLSLPSGLGVEGAGVVVAVGDGVTGFKAGDRIAYAGGPPGAYAEERFVPAARVLKLPDNIGFDAAADLQGTDSRVPDPSLLQREARRHSSISSGCWRCRFDRMSMAQRTGRNSHRHRQR